MASFDDFPGDFRLDASLKTAVEIITRELDALNVLQGDAYLRVSTARARMIFQRKENDDRATLGRKREWFEQRRSIAERTLPRPTCMHAGRQRYLRVIDTLQTSTVRLYSQREAPLSILLFFAPVRVAHLGENGVFVSWQRLLEIERSTAHNIAPLFLFVFLASFRLEISRRCYY